MSWSTFKNNLLNKMSAYPYEDNSGFAQAFAEEYDRCIECRDLINKL